MVFHLDIVLLRLVQVEHTHTHRLHGEGLAHAEWLARVHYTPKPSTDRESANKRMIYRGHFSTVAHRKPIFLTAILMHTVHRAKTRGSSERLLDAYK